MADRKTASESPRFTITTIERGIEKLRRRIEEVKDLNPSKVQYNDQSVKNVTLHIDETLSDVFGADYSPKFLGFLPGPSILYEYRRGIGPQVQDTFAKAIPQTVERLEGCISRLEEKRGDLEAEQEVDQPGATSSDNSSATSRKVFVVHGRDELAKEKVRTFLNKLDLEPVILDEQPNRGNTVIEKFEENADVAFAVVLFTPDDAGGLADSSNEPRPRARQNVIFELGFFVAKLGRANVCLLHKDEVEMMSDYYGVIYVPMNDGGGWRLKLAQEIENAGIKVDANQLLQ